MIEFSKMLTPGQGPKRRDSTARLNVTLSLSLLACAIGVGCAAPSGEQAAEPLTPEPAVAPQRHVELQGQPNFRDLGGYETVDGRTVKWGEVYRTGELPHLTDEDVVALEDLGIKTVVNFLVPEEIEMSGRDRLPAGAREVPQPITGRVGEMSLEVQAAIRSGAFDSIPPEMNPEFHRALAEDGVEEYAALLREAMDPTNRPLAFHCSHGVHRTGTASAILLSALGVPWETVRQDYLLSNTYRAEEIEAQLARIRGAVATARGVPPDEVDMINVEAFFVIRGNYIDGTLDEAVETYGSMEDYIREGLGISDEEIERLRAELLR